MTKDSNEFNPVNIVEYIIGALNPTAQEKGLRLSWRVDPDIPRALGGNPIRLHQILLNLVNNAIQSPGVGEVALRVTTGGSNSEGILLRFEVRDDGPSIPESDLHKLFQPFQEGFGDSAVNNGGGGRDFFLVKHLVELMGGEICLQSESGRGSTFWCSIPLKPVTSDSDDQSDTDGKAPGTDPSGGPNRAILLVEDDRLSRRMTSLQLEKLGYLVDSVCNGQEAVAAVEKAEYALVLMDCNMPVVDGYKAAREIRKKESGTIRHLPIIALTAYAMEGDREMCLKAGMDDYLTKPIIVEKLKEKLDHWCPFDGPVIPDRPPELSEPLLRFYEEIDCSVFLGLKQLQIEGNPNVINELVGIYLRDTVKRIGLMKEAEKRKDLKDLQKTAHSLKSISSMIGVVKVAGLCRDLEAGCRDGRMDEVADKVAQIERTCNRVFQILKDIPMEVRYR